MSSDSRIFGVALRAEGLAFGILLPTRMTVREELSTSYVIEVEASLPEGSLNSAALLRKAAQIVVYDETDGSTVRRFGGVITRVRERAQRVQRAQAIVLTIESPLAPLRLWTDCCIHQNYSSKDIVASGLEACGVDPGAISWRLSSPPPQREVCTQYAETMFQFVSRLLEEDGIFYFFEFEDDKVTVVFGDGDAAYSKVQPTDAVSHLGAAGPYGGDSIADLVEFGRIRPSKVTLRSHDFKKPALSLEVSAQATAPFGRELYDYPGRYVVEAEGKRRAKNRLDALVAEHAGVSGTSSVFGLSAGHTLTITGAPDASLDVEWVVREVLHEWERQVEATDSLTASAGATYRNMFVLLPKKQQFRPPLRTPRPFVTGPHSAIVTGPSGQEIDCDEFGRVHVQFAWDLYGSYDDKSSCWVRVNQMQTSGSVVIPRVGWEVLVEFEDGDPDKPIIIGKVNNAQDPAAYSLPAQKTVTSLKSLSSPGSAGNNEIRLDDGSGSEIITIHAQKDMNMSVANDKATKVTTTHDVGVTVDEQVTVGADQTVKVSANHTVQVGGAQKWSVGGSRTKTVTGQDGSTVVGARSKSIGGSHTVMTALMAQYSTTGSYSETVAGSALEAGALGVSMACLGSGSFTVGAAKIEACATGKKDTTIGARASTIGGALLNATGKDVNTTSSAAKATTVGGVWMANAGGETALSAKSALKINVGGAVILTGASELVLKVGGSCITCSGGAVVLDASEVKLTATGPNAELCGVIGDK